MELKFDHLNAVYLLAAVALLAGLAAYGFAWKRKAIDRFATSNLFSHLFHDFSLQKQKIRSALVVGALVFLVAAIMGPRWGTYTEEVQRKGVDIIIALDVSRSMLAADVKPSRLEAAKQDIRDLLTVLKGDRIGLVTFAGVPVLRCPLTTDYGFYRLILDEVTTESSPRGGSLIGDAVRLAVKCFEDSIPAYKEILVITDGEDQNSDPLQAAAQAYAEHGIRVHTMGIGDSQTGGRIPILLENGQRVFLQHEGQEVWSKTNLEVLQQMADSAHGNGVYIPAGTRTRELDVIYQQKIGNVEQRTFDTQKKTSFVARFQWFVAGALALLLAEMLMSDRRALPA